MWTACAGQLSELQQEALKQALEAESWFACVRASYPSVQNLATSATKRVPSAEFSWILLHELRPHSVDTLVMNTERFWFFYRVKQKIEPSWILRRSVVTTMSSKLGLTRGRCNREKYRNTRSEWERWRRKTDLNDRKEKEKLWNWS